MDITTPKTIRVYLSTNTGEYGEIDTYGDLTLYMRGDVDSSGTLNVLDIVLTIGYILSTSELTNDQAFRADYNGDNDVNILDVVNQVSVILNG